MTKFGIIIAIEEYSNSTLPQLSNIEFALNDANSIKTAFIDQLYIENKNLIFLTNEAADVGNIKNSLEILMNKMNDGDECYFYYVGHGFNAKSQNRITCWDTDNSNLEESSLALQEILLIPLRTKGCSKSFIFIDSSAEELKSINKLRSAAGNLNEKEFSELVRDFPGHSFFLSCYPGERSFSSAKAKHGIWAHHLINAMNGKEDNAIDKNNAITNISLNNFLSSKIPQYITKTMLINDRQSPFGVINDSLNSPLIKFESDDDELE
ncbi:MAG: caspase family protein, partial [Bacteriovorax sp.]|nr:caspase family protein [Bacteriovorax sp.]